MVFFTQKEVEWISSLILKVEEETPSKESSLKLKTLREKVDKINRLNLNISISQEEVKNTTKVIQELDSLYKTYSNLSDIADLEQFDSLKKEITGKLVYLSTYRDLFINEVSYLDDVLRKEIRITLVMDIKEDEGCSFSQADKLVEKDLRYTNLRDTLYQYKAMSVRLKTKYDFYLKAWQMVFQSCSSAAKERAMAKYD